MSPEGTPASILLCSAGMKEKAEELTQTCRVTSSLGRRLIRLQRVTDNLLTGVISFGS